MSDDHLYRLALELLRGNETYIADAREGAPVGNSVVGSLLAIQHKAPRQYTEEAVRQALRTLDAEAAKAEFRCAEVHEYAGKPDTITLPRTGLAPLRFSGELLAEADGYRVRGREQNRWHELAVYKTPGGKWVVRIAFRTQWQGELDYDHAEIVTEASAVEDAFATHQINYIRGFPDGPSHVDRQRKLLADIQSRYDALVSEILAADPAFAEEVG